MTLRLKRQRERAGAEGLRYLQVEVLRGKIPGAAAAEVVLGPTAGLEPVQGINKVKLFAKTVTGSHPGYLPCKGGLLDAVLDLMPYPSGHGQGKLDCKVMHSKVMRFGTPSLAPGASGNCMVY